MKIFFLVVLIACYCNHTFCQQGNTIYILVPHKNVRAAEKIPIIINGNKFVMKEGSFASLFIYADTAVLSFCSKDWKLQKGTTYFPVTKAIFLVAYYDRTVATSTKYFFRQVRINDYNRMKKKCSHQIRITH